MCNLYSHTKDPKAIRDLANATGGDWLDNAGNLEPQPAIFPDAVVPVVRSMHHGGRELIKMRWGFPSPPQAKSPYTTNARHLERRCGRLVAGGEPLPRAGHQLL
jgi:putative SOS response-associated peptidase YedK